MRNTNEARCFRELPVYQTAKEVAGSIFELSKNFPREEMHALTGQIRRASRSIGAKIAKAWGKRRHEKYFICKLTDADAAQLETQHWLGVAVSCGYLTAEQEEKLRGQLQEIERMLNGVMDKAHIFCGQDFFRNQEETDPFKIVDP